MNRLKIVLGSIVTIGAGYLAYKNKDKIKECAINVEEKFEEAKKEYMPIIEKKYAETKEEIINTYKTLKDKIEK
jgi:hypothetical protein